MTPTDDPQKDPNAIGDPFKTLFISRLSYEATESDLSKEFGVYGPIERIRLVRDQEGKSRGYAFIIYEREKDTKTAYKDADGLKILGRRILVDVERGRTVKDWKPMRLGGGLGASQSTRKKKEVVVEAPAAMGEFKALAKQKGTALEAQLLTIGLFAFHLLLQLAALEADLVDEEASHREAVVSEEVHREEGALQVVEVDSLQEVAASVDRRWVVEAGEYQYELR